MAYVGNPIDTQNTFQSLVGKRFNGDGSTTAFTLDVAPSSTLDLEVFVGNVRQDPNSAYTLSGTTLTFTGAPPSGTNNIYVVHQAKSVGTIGIPDDTISARTLVTADSSADHVLIEDATDGELKKALYPSANADGFFATSGLSSKDLGAGLHLKTADSGQSSVSGSADELVVEGSGDSGITILSGASNSGNIFFGDSGDDNEARVLYNHSTTSLSLFTAGSEALKIDGSGHVTMPLQPCFLALNDGGDTINNATDTTIPLDTEAFDLNGDVSSNTFTAPVTGKYFINGAINLDAGSSSNTRFQNVIVMLTCSNRKLKFGYNTVYSNEDDQMQLSGSGVIDMDANDTCVLQVFCSRHGASGATTTVGSSTDLRSGLGGYLVA